MVGSQTVDRAGRRSGVDELAGCGSSGSVRRELVHPLVSVGLAFFVDGCHRLEPLQRVGPAAGGQERIGVGVPETWGPGLLLVAVERSALKADDGGVVLAAVAAGAGQHDCELNASGRVELADVRVLGEGESAVGTAETAFAVGKDRQ